MQSKSPRGHRRVKGVLCEISGKISDVREILDHHGTTEKIGVEGKRRLGRRSVDPGTERRSRGENPTRGLWVSRTWESEVGPTKDTGNNQTNPTVLSHGVYPLNFLFK